MSHPKISIVIPVHREEAILAASTGELCENLRRLGWDFELLLAENGSDDATLLVAQQLAALHAEVSYLSIGEPNYGKALRAGIERARGEFVICEEIDLCDVDFHVRAIQLLDQDAADFVIGSKLLPEATDERPWLRHAASHAYSGMLRLAFGYRGTDTHGLKAFRRNRLLPVVAACVVDRDVFASELVLRAQRADLRLIEIPVRVREKREPSVHLGRRVPSVMTRLVKLWWALRT